MNVQSILDGLKIEYRENVPAASLCTIGIGGNAPAVAFPKTEEELVSLLIALRKNGIPFELVGNGSNLFFPDAIDFLTVSTARLADFSFDGNLLKAQTGCLFPTLANRAAEAGLSGLEGFCGIPGTVGGGVAMNCGAFGAVVRDLLVCGSVLDVNSGKIAVYENADFAFGERESVLQSDRSLVLLGAVFALHPGNKERIRETMKEYARKRASSQPLSEKSAGSYYRRPENDFAGRLIESAGLKGYRHGNVKVSEKHAGFFINCGGATAKELLETEAYVTETVAEKFGVTLSREVKAGEGRK